MTLRRRKPNRGPAAARDNRAALLAAAREVFSERGFHAPFSAIAKRAGVGQGVLYRHFPSRLAIAFAAFDANWAEFDALAEGDDPRAFERQWALLVDKTINERAFIEMVIDARRNLPEYDGERRLKRTFAKSLKRAQAAGLLSGALKVDDVLLAQRAVLGLVLTSPDPTRVRREATRVFAVAARLPALT